MPTHYHLYATLGDVSSTIHKLNRRYAVAYNRRYRRRGHVFDSPFSRTPVEHEEQARDLACYIALNPPDPGRSPYASYPGLIGTRPPFSFVDAAPILASFGSVDLFREFVDAKRRADDLN